MTRSTTESLLVLLRNIKSMSIPGMNWTDGIGRQILADVETTIANLEKDCVGIEDPPPDKDSAHDYSDLWPEAGSVYRHYKGGLYVVVCASVDETTLRPLVTYRSCRTGKLWTRELKEFQAVNEVDGKKVKRFRLQGLD